MEFFEQVIKKFTFIRHTIHTHTLASGETFDLRVLSYTNYLYTLGKIETIFLKMTKLGMFIIQDPE